MKPRLSRIISRNELGNLDRLPPGKAHWVRKVMQQLEVEEVFQVYRIEWNWLYKTPNVIVAQENAKGKKRFTFSVATDDKSWYIERVE